jgi:DNA polymerase zeta
VYLPCILQTKKRYVGYMYETRDQLKPEYDAKGIETVRYSLKKLQVDTVSLVILFTVKNSKIFKGYYSKCCILKRKFIILRCQD